MKIFRALSLALPLVVGTFLLQNCGGGSNNKNWVVVYNPTQPEMLNPTNYSDAFSSFIMDNIFQTLYVMEENPPYGLQPQLAKGQPIVSPNGLEYTFEIRPEAKWDDGSPITAKDYAFSLKILKVKKVKCDNQRPLFDNVKDVVIDPQNDRKFTVRLSQNYAEAEFLLGEELRILPAYVYDKQGVLNKISFEQLADSAFNANSPELAKFAEEYNSPKYEREKGYVVGSGPYELDKWVSDQMVGLSRKKHWWADSLRDQPALQAFPERIIYKIIKDPAAAVVALKSGQLDVMYRIPAKDFKELEQNEKFKQGFNLSTPPAFQYFFFNMNCRPKDSAQAFFTDRRVRRAMANIADPDLYIEKISYGMAKRTAGPVNPLNPNYNTDLQPIPHDIEAAKKLLDEAGWKDADSNGVREKMINNQKVEFSFELSIVGANPAAEQAALIFKEDAKKAGVEVKIATYESPVLITKTKMKDYQMYFGGWSASPRSFDQKQIWHTQSWVTDGYNFGGFGNKESDELIDRLRTETDPVKRGEMLKTFQKMVYEDQPYVFLYSPLEKIAIHKRFKNAETSAARPGFRVRRFQYVEPQK